MPQEWPKKWQKDKKKKKKKRPMLTIASFLKFESHGKEDLESQVSPSKKFVNGVPVVAQWLTNPTRNHEVAGSIPGLAQWVKDPALL